MTIGCAWVPNERDRVSVDSFDEDDDGGGDGTTVKTLAWSEVMIGEAGTGASVVKSISSLEDLDEEDELEERPGWL
jgi:hypothetical protein